jgi:gluconate 5-dehydrogenase
MMSAFSLQDDVALITGGGSGIGLGIAQCMVESGAKVVLTGRREEVLKEAVAGLGDQASYYVHDVRELEAAPGLIKDITDSVGQPTILVNNAGIQLKKATTEFTDEEFANLLQTHVMGAFALSRTVLPGMVERGSGSILFISSMASYMGLPYVVAYSAAKSAYHGIIRTLSSEFAGSGVRTNGIAPGWIETEMVRKATEGDPERKAKILGRTPMNKMGEPKDIGWAAVYLASPAAKFVTGEVVVVDGGASVGF